MFYRGKKRAKKEPDAFQKTFAGPLQQLSGSGIIPVLLLVGLLVVIVVVWLAARRSTQNESAAQARLAAAIEQPNDAERLAALAKLADEASGSQARPLALLAEAALLQDTAVARPESAQGQRAEDLKKALAGIDRFLADYPRHRLVPLALERKALLLEDAGSYADAAAAFEKAAGAVRETDFAYLRGKLLYGQARCQNKLGQSAEAVKKLEEALRPNEVDGNAPWRQAATVLLAQLRPAPKDLRVKGAAEDKPAVTEESTSEKSDPAGASTN